MKSFIATLLAAGAMAAIEEKKWTGTQVSGDVKCTPSGSSSYDGKNTDITVTWKTTATLSAKMAEKKKCQVWWCDVESTTSTHCHLWQFEQGKTDAENQIKGRVYAGASVPSIPDNKNAKDWFQDDNSSKWSTDTLYNVPTDSDQANVAGKYTGVKSSTTFATNGKSATGVFTRQYTSFTSTAMKKGTENASVIGAYVSGGKGLSKAVKTGVDIAQVSPPTTTKGAKKSWTGPKVEGEGNTFTAGGYTEWTKNTTAGDATHALTSWMCQTATGTAALSGDMNATVWLNDKAAKPTVELWQMEKKELKLRKYKLDASFEPAAGADKSPKDVVAKGTKIMDEDYIVEDGKVANGTNHVDKTKTGISGKIATGCTQTFETDKTKIATAVKGSTKTYQQGMWYTKKSKDDSKVTMSDVSVVIASEAGASSLLTALGAVAVGVAALAF